MKLKNIMVVASICGILAVAGNALANGYVLPDEPLTVENTIQPTHLMNAPTTSDNAWYVTLAPGSIPNSGDTTNNNYYGGQSQEAQMNHSARGYARSYHAEGAGSTNYNFERPMLFPSEPPLTRVSENVSSSPMPYIRHNVAGTGIANNLDHGGHAFHAPAFDGFSVDGGEEGAMPLFGGIGGSQIGGANHPILYPAPWGSGETGAGVPVYVTPIGVPVDLAGGAHDFAHTSSQILLGHRNQQNQNAHNVTLSNQGTPGEGGGIYYIPTHNYSNYSSGQSHSLSGSGAGVTTTTTTPPQVLVFPQPGEILEQ